MQLCSALKKMEFACVQGSLLFVASAAFTVFVPKLKAIHARRSSYVGYWMDKENDHDFLKDVLGEKATEWVNKENEKCLSTLGDPTASRFYEPILSILDSNEKIPYVSKINDHYYNFWQDKANARGLWRRTSLASYRSEEPVWETVLDIDALGKAENESWVYKGCSALKTSTLDSNCDPTKRDRCLVHLSRGGADATVVREFDLSTLKFVEAAADGFVLPEAKSRVSWKSADVLLVGTDMKDGKSMTDSGYPRVIREWRRGQPLSEATVQYEGENTDVSVSGYMHHHRGYHYEVRDRSMTFYTSKHQVRYIEGDIDIVEQLNEQPWRDVDVPDDAQIDFFADQLLISLRSDWTLFDNEKHGSKVLKQGSLLAVSIKEFLADRSSASITCLFEPSATKSLESYTDTKDFIIIETLDKVKSRLIFWKYVAGKTLDGTAHAGNWELMGEEPQAVIRGTSVTAVDNNESNMYWLTVSSFLRPTTLYLVDAEHGVEGIPPMSSVTSSSSSTDGAAYNSAHTEKHSLPIKTLPAMFDASLLEEKQFEAVSEDGTKVPYFMISPKGMKCDGTTPVLLYGYGGFEISITPSYSAVMGATWLNRKAHGVDTCYVIANIRGGGEFGPKWHQAALRENRKLAYDDFIAVAEDLIKRKVTSPRHLGIRGGSNGGLLMGNMMVRRPDLFGAVVCQVPLLNMRCYNKLLAGASWVAEYGDPDNEEDWSFLQRYSPYHNIDVPSQQQQGTTAGGVGSSSSSSYRYRYPRLLMTTSTRDDRVHPYHARCFVKRLQEVREEYKKSGTSGSSSSTSSTTSSSTSSSGRRTGSVDNHILYYENREGGHAGAADSKQQAFVNAMYIEFLLHNIVDQK